MRDSFMPRTVVVGKEDGANSYGPADTRRAISPLLRHGLHPYGSSVANFAGLSFLYVACHLSEVSMIVFLSLSRSLFLFV
jgi:hypothetical protein